MNYPAIRAFMKHHYSDEKLAMLLAHAESGRLAYQNCCCFIGIATADHALRGQSVLLPHYFLAKKLHGANEAESEFKLMGNTWFRQDNGVFYLEPPRSGVIDLLECDELRRERIIPLIREEMARRERLRAYKREIFRPIWQCFAFVSAFLRKLRSPKKQKQEKKESLEEVAV